jgi:Fe-S cluster assembly scaffold protein SufB
MHALFLPYLDNTEQTLKHFPYDRYRTFLADQKNDASEKSKYAPLNFLKKKLFDIDKEWIPAFAGMTEAVKIIPFSQKSPPAPFLQPHHSLAAFNGALLTEGYFIEISDSLTQPLNIYYHLSGEETLISPRICILVKKNVKATLIENFEAKENTSIWQNSVLEIVLEEGAELKYVSGETPPLTRGDKIRRIANFGQCDSIGFPEGKMIAHEVQSHIGVANGGDFCTPVNPPVDCVDSPLVKGAHFVTHSVLLYQGKNSRCEAWHINDTGLFSRYQLNAFLQGEHSSFYLKELLWGKNSDLNASFIEVHHEAHHTISEVLSKGLADDKSEVVFQGSVFVPKHIKKIRAKQYSKNRLLSDKAKINTKPELFIDADDLACAHGATIGQLDEAEYYYCLSRGLDPADAKKILNEGFVREIYEGIEHYV